MYISIHGSVFVSEDLGDQSSDQLVIQCAMCGRTFPSGIYVDRRSIEAANPTRKVHECPFCGFTTAYDPTDYRYKSG